MAHIAKANEKTTQQSERPESILKHQLTSSILGEQRNIFIMLPQDYTKSESIAYDVIYVISSNRLAYHLSLSMQLLALNERLPKTIIVSIPTKNKKNISTRTRDLTPPFLKQDLDDLKSPYGEADKFLDFIDAEVDLYIQQTYRATNKRILVGHSRAGLLALYSLLYKPQMFSAQIALSPALWREENMFVTQFIAQLSKIKLEKNFLYMSMGELEVPKMKQAFDLIAVKLSEIELDGLSYFSHYQPYADHTNNLYLTVATGLLGYYRQFEFDKLNVH
jgi:predicted alpha/beta superfamily hydrolase